MSNDNNDSAVIIIIDEKRTRFTGRPAVFDTGVRQPPRTICPTRTYAHTTDAHRNAPERYYIIIVIIIE